jgi:CRP-like cAMP-binding protein
MDTQAREVISHLPMFHDLAPAYIDRLASESKLINLSRGEILFHRGDHAPGFYILTGGQIKLGFSSAQGAEKIIDIVTPGKSFGEAITFLDRQAPVTAQAIQHSKLILIPRKALFTILQEDPGVACSMLASLSARMHHLVNSIESISLLSGAQRLIGYLLQLNSLSPEASTLTLGSTKANIASLLNISPETLSRIMHKLTEDGLIAVNGKEIDILDIEGLRNYECDF